MKLRLLSIILALSATSFLFTGCEPFNDYYWEEGYIDCRLSRTVSDRNGVFASNQWNWYYLGDIKRHDDRPMYADIADVRAQNSWIEISTPNYISDYYVIRELTISFGDRSSEQYTILNLNAIVYDNRITSINASDFNGLVNFIDNQFMYQLATMGQAKVAVRGVVTDSRGYLINRAVIDVLIKNDVEVQIRN